MPLALARHGPHRRREVGEGRTARQSGQVRKEAALTRQGGSLSNLPLLIELRTLDANFASAAGLSAEEAKMLDATLTAGFDSLSPNPAPRRRPIGCWRGNTGPCARGPHRPGADGATLANSFAADRIHQAYILTGVRGVGKTTTARILARAFNYSVPARSTGQASTCLCSASIARRLSSRVTST